MKPLLIVATYVLYLLFRSLIVSQTTLGSPSPVILSSAAAYEPGVVPDAQPVAGARRTKRSGYGSRWLRQMALPWVRGAEDFAEQ